jgi:uncharacterized protein YbdZ (MbtH family)
MSGEPVSINPFNDDNGSFFVLVNDEEQHSLWATSATFQLAGGWCTAKRTALHVWITSNKTGPRYGRRIFARRWQRVGLLITKPCGLGEFGWSFMTGHFR